MNCFSFSCGTRMEQREVGTQFIVVPTAVYAEEFSGDVGRSAAVPLFDRLR